MKTLEKFFYFIKLKIQNLKHGEEIMEAIDIAEKQRDEQIEFENQLIKKVKLEDAKKP